MFSKNVFDFGECLSLYFPLKYPMDEKAVTEGGRSREKEKCVFL